MAIIGDRKNRRRNLRILVLAVLALGIGGISSIATMAQSGPGNSQGGQGAAIEGTWIMKVLPAGAPAPFIALVSFAAGGVTEATGTADRNSPFASAAAPQSILIGSWRQSGNNTTGPDSPGAERRITELYVSTLPFFSFDTGGNALNMYKNYITYSLNDNNTLKGMGNTVKCDIDGTNCVPYESITISGTRLVAQGASN